MDTPTNTEPKITQRDEFLVMGTLTRIAPGTESGEQFAAIWNGFEERREQIESHSTDKKYYGVSFATSEAGRFDYVAGMAVTPVENIPDGLVVRQVPAATYAVFACPVQSIGQTYGYIFGEWRSNSRYQIDNSAPSFEQYPPAADAQSPVLIHIPVRVNEPI